MDDIGLNHAVDARCAPLRGDDLPPKFAVDGPDIWTLVVDTALPLTPDDQPASGHAPASVRCRRGLVGSGLLHGLLLLGLLNLPATGQVAAVPMLRVTLVNAPMPSVAAPPDRPPEVRPTPPPEPVETPPASPVAVPVVVPEPLPAPIPEPVVLPTPPRPVEPPVRRREQAVPPPVTRPLSVDSASQTVDPSPPVATVNGAPDQGREDAIEAFKARLHAAIQAAREYPRRARIRRHDGTAVVAFRLLATGAVEEIELLRSSGWPELDAAALHAVRGMGSMPIPGEFGKSSWRFEVPVRFHLSDG